MSFKKPHQPTLYTVGHSTYKQTDFLNLLRSFDIKTVADIRRFPGSKKYPWFNKEELEAALQHAGIGYVHLEGLGGRRKVQEGSKNSRWRNASFRGYADYMETDEFREAIAALEAVALEQPTTYMCAEAVWWRCHRSIVSDCLKAKGWTVLHIMSAGKAEEHAFTSPARVVKNQVLYSDAGLFAP
jgi:uncharacterized protein (DUF488 family)